ncbi:MAG: hypothetical protein KKA54_04000 [Proteobacteria bacterium]|nr:hypothetical protein [Pseudomonadota bacterium]
MSWETTQEDINKKHKLLAKAVARYLSDAPLLNILTSPFIWSCIILR